MDRYVEAGHVQHQRTRTKATTPSATANIWKTSNTRKAKRIRRRRALPKANNNTAVKRLGATGKLIKSKDPVNDVRPTQLTQRNTDQRPQPRRSHHTGRPASESFTPTANRNGSTMGTHHHSSPHQ